jgi:hypothetical protein
MKKHRTIILSVLLLTGTAIGGYSYFNQTQEPAVVSCCTEEATCYGLSTCKACKNCKYCKYCSKDGGTCGVCD